MGRGRRSAADKTLQRGGLDLKGRYAAWAVPLAFTALGAWAVQRSLGSFSALAQVRPAWPDLVAAALIYPVFAATRGIRFRQLLSGHPKLGEAIGLGWLYSAACSVLPGGLGEVSLPLLFRGAPGGAASATAALFVSRVQDLLSWLLALAVASLTVRVVPGSSRVLLVLSLLATGAATAVVFVPVVRRRFVGIFRVSRSARLHGFLDTVELQLGSMSGNLPSWGTTGALRLLSVASYYFSLRAFGAQVSFAEAAVGGALVALLLVLPIQGIAGFGTVEVWWILSLQLFGVPLPVAAAAAIGVHVSSLVLSLAVGAISLRATPRLWSARPAHSP